MARIHQLKPRAHRVRKRRMLRRTTFCACSPPAPLLVQLARCATCRRFARPISKADIIWRLSIFVRSPAATESDIIAAPTLIKDEPLPSRRMVGDLSDRPKVLSNLAIAGGSK
jgi:hypothetical protein